MAISKPYSYQFTAMPPSVGRPKRATIQARVGEDRARCSLCDITYNVPGNKKPLCPLCEKDKIIQKLRDEIYQLSNSQNQVLNELDRAKSEIDNLHAMKSALEAISPQDLAWVKQILYRWQADRQKVAMKPTHGAPSKTKRGNVPVDGFIAMFRDGSETEVYQCNSVGGLALAGYLEEAIALVGQIKAIEMLARAVMSKMPGGVSG